MVLWCNRSHSSQHAKAIFVVHVIINTFCWCVFCVCGVVICCIWMRVCIGVFSYLPMRLQANKEKSRDKMQCIRWIIVWKCILCNAIFSRHFFGSLSVFLPGQTITIFNQWCKVKLKMKINRQCMDMSTHNPNH